MVPKRNCRLLLFCLLIVGQAYTQSDSFVTVSGKVSDAATGSPLANVNVFIANTTRGAATDNDGRFEIKRLNLGRHELVASRIGYERKKLKLTFRRPHHRTLDIKLKPKVIELKPLEVSAKQDKNWQENFKKFAELFLGSSPNAAQCEIVNREVLDFKKETSKEPFRASAQVPLEIVNRALGYRLSFMLDRFEAKGQEVSYRGDARFEELQAQDSGQRKKWQQKRLQTYQGSLRHFLKSLHGNRLSEQGFLAELVPEIGTDKHGPFRSEVKRHELLSSGELPNERYLNFNNILEVTYTKELEDQNYIDYRMANDLSLRGARFEHIERAREARNQQSWLLLQRVDVAIDTMGLVLNPLSVRSYGYWAWERVAELLPRDYQPDAPAKTPELIAADARDYFDEGTEALQSGDWKTALEIWSQGQKALKKQAQVDPRIGFALIELITERNERLYHAFACDAYYWSFSADTKKFRNEFEEELGRMSPLLDESTYEEWQRALAQGQSSLQAKIKRFWIERDPTPTTILNERLIEHWERIAVARQRFVEAQNTVYGTDDRGLLYVKYGEPEQIHKVTLGTDPGEIQTMAGWYNIRAIEFSEFRRGIEDHLTYPDCEVWVYQSLHEQEPIVYLFGLDEGSGSYGLRSGVEEFIPDRAFRSTSARYTAGVIPGAVIQMMYYNRLSPFDLSFASRRDELEQEFARDAAVFTNVSQVRGLRNKFKILDEQNPTKRQAPLDHFNRDGIISELSLRATRSRFLDDKNNPRLVFVAFAFPTDSDSANGDQVIADHFDSEEIVRFTVLVRDANMNVLERFQAAAVDEDDHTAVFKLPHRATYEHYTLAAKSRKRDDAATGRYTKPNVGRVFFEKTEPLRGNPQEIEISDLVIGVTPPENFERGVLPFPVVPTSQIWKEDVLKVYLEVYHLRLDKNGAGRFRLESTIVRLKKKDSDFERQELIATSFEFDSDKPTSRQDFGISIAQYEPGDYEIDVEVVDTVSGQKKKRSARFEIVNE